MGAQEHGVVVAVVVMFSLHLEYTCAHTLAGPHANDRSSAFGHYSGRALVGNEAILDLHDAQSVRTDWPTET